MPKRPAAERKRRQQAKRELQRDRERIARVEYDRLEAIRREDAAEEMAPKAQRQAIVTADGVVLRPPLAVPDTENGRFRRGNPLIAMYANGHGRTVTRAHLKAATKLKNDYDTGIEGARSPRAAIVRVDSGGASEAEYPWLDAITNYNAALAAVGPMLRGIVHAIACDWVRVGEIAKDNGTAESVTVGLIVAGLDRLAEHYEPGVTAPKLVAPPLAGPGAFDFAISAIGEAMTPERFAGMTRGFGIPHPGAGAEIAV